ncbi:hypothetical protein GW943_03285 [Candidatus Parcubacteria bacterium]|nr:hypothetical protein [Candidatus Parcubacteria bacterium]
MDEIETSPPLTNTEFQECMVKSNQESRKSGEGLLAALIIAAVMLLGLVLVAL